MRVSLEGESRVRLIAISCLIKDARFAALVWRRLKPPPLHCRVWYDPDVGPIWKCVLMLWWFRWFVLLIKRASSTLFLFIYLLCLPICMGQAARVQMPLTCLAPPLADSDPGPHTPVSDGKTTQLPTRQIKGLSDPYNKKTAELYNTSLTTVLLKCSHT